MAFPGKIRQFFRGEFGTGLGIIIIAALLVEMISIVQYNKLSSLFYHDMDVRSRIVLGSMADNISHTLELTETTMRENEWEIRHYLPYPDSMFNAIVRLIDDNRHVVGGCIGFVPDYYKDQGRWFEPYVTHRHNSIKVSQIGSAQKDYLATSAEKRVDARIYPVRDRIECESLNGTWDLQIDEGPWVKAIVPGTWENQGLKRAEYSTFVPATISGFICLHA